MVLSACSLIAVCAALWPAPGDWPASPQEPSIQGGDVWRGADFAVLASELSPAVLVRSTRAEVRLFANTAAWGLGGPTLLGAELGGRPRLTPGPAELACQDLSAPWLLVSFAGASGWQLWDTPWLVVLQHRPARAVLDDTGLALTFANEAGTLALMPLYGAYKPPLSEEALAARPVSAPPPLGDLRPWQWRQASSLPAPVVERCRLWSRLLRYWPLDCREEVQIVPGQDLLRLRCRFTHVETADDWGTEGMKLSPLPPTLALALETGFPARLSDSPRQLDLPTAFGSYVALPGDEYIVEFPLLQYVHETETQQTPNLDDPAVALAAGRVAEVMTRKFRGTDEGLIWDHGGGGNFCWQVMGDRYYPKALAYAPEQARENARAVMHAYVRDWVLNAERYRPFRDRLILVGPGIGTWGGYDDAGKFASNVLETLWWYAYYTGDWDVVRERWDLVHKLFITPRECRWRGVGRDAIAEMGDEPQPPLCLARMAYRIGDLDTYAYACHVFVRELVHCWVKTEPACGEWFRARQPWHNTEPMRGRLLLTNLWGHVAGWQIDGPDYPEQTGERQYRNRWVRFGNEDVARFFREHLGQQVRAELAWWATRQDSPYQPGRCAAHIAPSLEQLRSLLLNEAPADLAALAPLEKVSIGRAGDALSYYLSFIRTGRPVEQTRLVPAEGRPSPWTLGLSREAEGSDGALAVHTSAREGSWPVLSVWGWPPPRQPEGLPSAKSWSFGQVQGADTPAAGLAYQRLSWTTVAWHSG